MTDQVIVPPLEVTGVTLDRRTGEVRLRLNRNPRTGPNVLRVIYPRDLRAGAQLINIELRLREILRFLLVKTLGVLYVRFMEAPSPDGPMELRLGVAAPDDMNHQELVASVDHLTAQLHRLMWFYEPPGFAVRLIQLLDPDSPEHVGFHQATRTINAEMAEELLRLFNEVLQAESINLSNEPQQR